MLCVTRPSVCVANVEARAIVRACTHYICCGGSRVHADERKCATFSTVNAVVGGKLSSRSSFFAFLPVSAPRFRTHIPRNARGLSARARVGALGTFRRATEHARSSRRAETTVASAPISHDRGKTVKNRLGFVRKATNECLSDSDVKGTACRAVSRSEREWATRAYVRARRGRDDAPVEP